MRQFTHTISFGLQFLTFICNEINLKYVNQRINGNVYKRFTSADSTSHLLKKTPPFYQAPIISSYKFNNTQTNRNWLLEAARKFEPEIPSNQWRRRS